jgi:NADH-quinone oxidoreductase subunit L
MYDLIKLVPLLPFVGFLVIGLFGKYLKKEWLIGGLASLTVGVSFIIACVLFIDFLGNTPSGPVIVKVYEWISAGSFSISISYQVDQLSLLFTLIITGVGFLIHVYSIGYMHGDRSYYRFFTYLNLFIFMMLNLVLADSFLLTFLGWEGVGLCSYLLIGFWYDKKFDGYRITWNGDAGNKAFIVNRIGDFGFLIAMFLIYTTFGTLEYTSVLGSASTGAQSFYDTGLMTTITLLLFLGCTGKSAQIPLAVWLPDAMAGPTPVSALIHAATMVTAGIFLIARTSVLFALSPISMGVVAAVGIATAFFAAAVGLVQNDMKKVLAYSTVSQLGFMFAALGVGAFSAGVFHVMTHAFFKGLLFLGAGSVIHGMHEQQNIKMMGGLKKYMPVTYITFFIATLAISGIPLFSGFFSKDEILWFTYANGGLLPWLILVISAFFTAFYMFRLLYLTFFGKERFDHHHVHPHESPKTMTVPLMVLAALSAVGGFAGIPAVFGHFNFLEGWLGPVFANAESVISRHHAEVHHSAIIEIAFMAISVVVALTAIFLARKYYKADENWTVPRKIAKNYSGLHRLLLDKWRLDNLYFATVVDPVLKGSREFLWKIFDMKFIDGFINGSARVVVGAGEYIKRFQTGIVQNYALVMLFGIIIILGWMVFSIK